MPVAVDPQRLVDPVTQVGADAARQADHRQRGAELEPRSETPTDGQLDSQVLAVDDEEAGPVVLDGAQLGERQALRPLAVEEIAVDHRRADVGVAQHPGRLDRPPPLRQQLDAAGVQGQQAEPSQGKSLAHRQRLAQRVVQRAPLEPGRGGEQQQQESGPGAERRFDLAGRHGAVDGRPVGLRNGSSREGSHVAKPAQSPRLRGSESLGSDRPSRGRERA